MGRSKQSKSGSAGGTHRKETKEERRLRLQTQTEAREKCLKYIPTAGGILVLVLVAFAIYVRTVPPYIPPTKPAPRKSAPQKPAPQKPAQGFSAEDLAKLKKQNINMMSMSELLGDVEVEKPTEVTPEEALANAKNAGEGGEKERLYTTPDLEEALANARKVLKNIEVTKGTIKEESEGGSPKAAGETAEAMEL